MSKHRATLLMLVLLFTFFSFSSQARGQSPVTLELVDESGAAASVYMEGSRVFVRVVDPYGNVSPGPDSVQVQMSASRSGDVEPLYLTETSAGVFRGSIRLAPGSGSQPGVLETAADPNPPYDRDTIQASYGGGFLTETASLAGSRTWFLDGAGNVRQSFAVGERVHVRVADSLRNDPSTLTSFQITVAVPATGEQELVYVQETGIDTGIFEGSIATVYQPPSSGNGLLETAAGQAIEVVHPDFDLPTSSRADATMVAGHVDLIDAQGRPAEYYLESSRVHVRVLDHVSGAPWSPDTLQVTLQADLSGDQELVTLTETGPATGIYEGSIRLRLGPGQSGNGTLETYYEGPPYRFDTVRATSGTSTDAVGMIGSLTSFVDAYGNEVESYPAGVAVRVRVEDHNFNDPSRRDTVGATVSSLSTGDVEGLTLVEVAKDSGIFEGSLATQIHAPGSPNDGYFPVQPGHEIEAVHTDFNSVFASGDRARIESASIAFVEGAGRPTAELLENGTARIRVISWDANGNPNQQDGLVVQVQSLRTGDQETVPLAETGPDTGIFEGTIQLSYSFAASQGNGLLETSNPPPYTGDQVTASYGSYSVTARTISARVVFLDGFGRETTVFPIGQPVRVRVTDPSSNDPSSRNTSYIRLSTCEGGESSDQESFQLTETGFNTGVFEGGIPSIAQSPSPNNGTLQVVESCVIRALYQNPNNVSGVEATARFTVGEVLFVDAQGRPASVYLEGTRAYLRVVDYSRAGTVQVNVTAEASGDQELVTLQETRPESGIFLGSVELRLAASGLIQNGILETSHAGGQPWEFETLRAAYQSLSGEATATASTLGFRLWFIDAYGAVTGTYTQGSRVYVRMENHNNNDPGLFDRFGVTLRTSGGDVELLYLLETGKATGIYEGFMDLENAYPSSFSDGRLQASAGEELEAQYVPEVPAVKARVALAEISFIDEAGRPTVELLENGMARVRVTSPYRNTDPNQADGMLVQLRSLQAGDQEDLPLAETGPDTGVFEGSIRLSFSFSVSQGNGVLETNTQGPEYLGDQVTASFESFSATARTIGARVVFIDGFGRETTAFPLGSRVRVRVTDPSRNNPTIQNETYVSLTSCQDDRESFQLTETGFDTGVFEGEVSSGAQSVFWGDGTLQGTDSCLILASYYNPNTPTMTEATATFTGGEVLFLDAQGQPASVFLEGTRAYLRVVDHGRSGSVTVEVTADLSGDREQVTLGEARPGIFEGSIVLRSSSPGLLQNGILETAQAAGPPHEFEMLRAVYQDPSGDATATASTLNFRLWFIDAYGAVTTTYAQGSRVYVRMENHNYNDPSRFDRLGVSVLTSRGDQEPLYLLETGKATGIYEGSIDLDGVNPPSANDGRLQAGSGDDLEARFDPEFNASPAKARVEHAAITFIDDAGVPTVELLENGTARVRVISRDHNGNPNQTDGMVVQLRSLYAGDQEDLPLAETGTDTSVFEGSIRLSFFTSSVTQGNNLLETFNSQSPAYLGDQVTAIFGPFSATARTIGARVVFIDGFGRETTTFPLGSRVRVRVTDPSRNTPTIQNETYVNLTACQNDQESFQLRETGFDTGVFEGEIQSGSGVVSSNDGILQGVESCLIQASYYNPNASTLTGATATFTGGAVLFVDAQGQPASVFLEGTRAYLRVVDHGRSGSVTVEVTAELSGDLEQMTLGEARPGVFEGSIALRSSAPGTAQNSILETAQAAGPPHEFETLRAVYQDPSGDATATASTLNFRLWFIDAYGAVTTTYAQGSRVYVRMENHNYNDPSRFDRLGVSVLTSRGDQEPLYLLETGKATGIYEGFIDLDGVNPPSANDGRLQAGSGDDLEARFDPEFNASPAKARVEHAAITFIDDAGVPTVELLENGTARVRVTSRDHNGNPNQADGMVVQVRSLYAGDQEDLPLAETGTDTGVFEGSIRLSFNPSASQGNNLLETFNSQNPEYLGDPVTAIFGPFSATARTIGARVVFIDGFGRETTAFPLGSRVRLRVTDPSRNTPTIQNETYVNLTACQNDEESFQLTETGFNTGVFEGEIQSGSGVVSSHDGTLQGTESCLIQASYYNPNASTLTGATATFTGGAVLFVDAQGQPASVFLEGTRAYLRVVDHGRSGSVTVEVTTELSGDLEQMTLGEARPGVFEGSIALRSSVPGTAQNGILETAQTAGPPHEFETLRAVYQDPSGDATATASTLNFRVWFIDAYGAVTTTYAQGSRVYVRMENHNYNDPSRFDRLGVSVLTSRGDQEPLYLLETGKRTGIYEGFIDLDGVNPPSANDGRLQAGSGDDLEARFDPEFNASPAKARVEHAAITFIDDAGVPTVELLENGTARVRVTSRDHNGNPNQADGMVVQVRSLYAGDQEDLPLAETGADTGVFEGSIRLSFNPSASQGNNLLETFNSQNPEYLGDPVTAIFGPFSATARTIGARVVFIDGFGRETATFPLGSRVRVRVTDPSRNTPTIQNETYVNLTACQNDQESFQLRETGFNTGVFEGEIQSGSGAVSSHDNILQGVESCLIQASYYNPNASTLTGATATFTGGAVLFVDAQGQPASVFLEGTRAYLRVVDHGRSGSVTVEVTTELSSDLEQMTLGEARPGVFEGSIELRSSVPGTAQNGILETAQAAGPPHEFETLRAVYQDPSGDATATASTLNFRLWFIDAYGAVTTTYAQRSRVYVRMENHNYSDPAQRDLLGVTVLTSRGDQEPLYLLETGNTTGIFEGFIDLDGTNPPAFNDGRLQAGPGDDLEARFDPEFNASPAKARVEHAAITFIDGAGVPTVELLENGAARVRVTSPDHIGNPGLQVQVRSFQTGDQEDLILTATGPETGVFEGSINLSFNVSASQGNGVLETGNQGPEYLGDPVTASFGPFSATARTVGSRVAFLNLRGQPTVSYSLGATVRVRIEEPSRNQSPAADTFGARVRSLSNGDEEFITMTETSPTSGIFEGSVPSTTSLGSSGDGSISAGAGDVVEVENPNFNQPTLTTARASFLANQAPQPVADAAETIEGQPVTVPVLANDSDPEADPLTVASFTQGTRGTVTLDPPGTVTYTPNAGETGQDTFTYLVTDPQGGEAVATVTITINPANRPPAANADTASVAEDGMADIAVLANDTDPDNNVLTVASVTQGANGTVSINPDNTVKYTPAANYNGSDSFTYTISDGNGESDTATVTVTVNPVNDAPVANADTATVAEDGAVDIAVLANDTDLDGGTTLTVASVTQGSNGAVSINPDQTVKYTPSANYNGTDSFSYTVSDGNGGTATATVSVTITAVNDAPVANPDAASGDEDNPVTATVLANDTDPEGNTLTVTGTNHQGAVVNADNTVTFAAGPNNFGTYTVDYTVSDGQGGTATGTVTFTVNEINDPPVAGADAATADEDEIGIITVLANDSDVENNALTVTSITQPANGTATLRPNNTVQYLSNTNYNGPDSFTYTVTDSRGATATATVSITVRPRNDVPVANPDTATVAEDGSVDIPVLANDTDLDGDTLRVFSTVPGTHGTVSSQPNGTIRYTPEANFHGTDTFTYKATDDRGGTTGFITVTVTVTPANDAPVANADTATVAEDGTVNVSVLSNDTDPENDTLTVTSVTQGTNGTVSINPDKTVKYTPSANYNGSDSFTYTISDGNGGSATATVTVTVTAVNDSPVANADTASVAEDGTVNVSVLSNDTDPENDTLTVTVVTQGTNGAVSINPDKTVKYTPSANYNGSDSFTYTVSDGNGGTATATVTVTVTAVNDSPVANADTASVAEDGTVNVSVLSNDTDPENDTLTVAVVTQGTNGAVSINPDKTVKYTPAANYNGTDSFTYTISDGNGGSATATVTVTVTAVNDSPVANADTASVAEDGTVNVSVLSNDTDPENDTLTVTAVTQGTNGAVSINPDKTLKYTPSANYNGSDSFTYTVSDGNGGTATATVTVTVTSGNDAPTANADSASVAEDGAVNVAVLANDSDPENDTLTVTSVTQGANGSVSINPDKTVRYAPAPNYSGSDSFTYTISDGNGGTATAAVAVTVTPVNDAPVAVNDTATVAAGSAVTIPVRANDTDVDGPSLTVTAVTQGARGTVTINAGQTVTYTAGLFAGTDDTFTYTVSDGAGGTATATVSVALTAPPRVTTNLQVRYDFNEGGGSTVNDTSGVGTPLNLTISPTSGVSWLPGALSVNSATIISSAGAATKVIDAVKISSAITVEAWVAADNLTQTGPARIVSINKNSAQSNIIFGQSANRYETQTSTSTGTKTQQTPLNSASTSLKHVVYTRNSAGLTVTYINGVQVASTTVAGSMSGWDTSMRLALANAIGGGKPWVGDMHLVAIYSRSLTATEVQQNFQAGASGN